MEIRREWAEREGLENCVFALAFWRVQRVKRGPDGRRRLPLHLVAVKDFHVGDEEFCTQAAFPVSETHTALM